ncbi:DUF1772 domain-containing protein [Marinomonas mediterranea]|jgi:Predicted integral membrane protein|uniref:DUF1772 domain-containing protein n=1 Tax=Marinomonas mediterranea (strain ATCC 700492 / JCM 21426 / NBRC 103028 / MMB-1) TaxID=717774 RepID=F2JYI5_MARM1|nr:DUF1772 domain-containing protein [Marinomonas mediterranea]ADZ93114.1 hypothetical protein Marme_3904 [Marinomonas mediterranea MMB-1]WCN19123.1 DUF1772 domain-containing protein [Marinomonas mediterranea MMB-1]
MKPTVRSLSGIITVLLFGLMAGFFATYSFNVNYAMLQVDGSTYATVQSLFNINVRHAGFFTCFFGAGIAPFVCALLSISNSKKAAILWGVLGVCYVLGIILFTKHVNLPLNYYTESWAPANLPDDWQHIRDQWNHANYFRSAWSISLFVGSLFLLTHQFHPEQKHNAA